VAEWAKDAGSLEGAGVGTLMGVADLGDAAAVYDETRRVEKKETTSRKRRGALSAVISIGIIVGLVFAVAAFASGTNNNNFNFGTTEPTATKSVIENPLDPNNPVVGTASITKDTPLLKEADASSEVVQELKKNDRVFQIGHDTKGFYPVKLATDEKVVGYVNKDDASIICPVQCG
jgi:hypothetical protein